MHIAKRRRCSEKTLELPQLSSFQEEKNTNLNIEQTIELARVILETTCVNYVSLLKVAKKYKNEPNRMKRVINCYGGGTLYNIDNEIKEIENFYGSEWFRLLTLYKDLRTSKEITDEIKRKNRL